MAFVWISSFNPSNSITDFEVTKHAASQKEPDLGFLGEGRTSTWANFLLFMSRVPQTVYKKAWVPQNYAAGFSRQTLLFSWQS